MSRFAPTGPISLGDIYNARATGVPDIFNFGQAQSTTGFGNTGSVMDAMSRSQHISVAGEGHINVTAPMCLDSKIYAGGRGTNRTGTNDLNSFRGKGAIYGVRDLEGVSTNYPYGSQYREGTGSTVYGNADNLWSDSNWTSTCHANLGFLGTTAVGGYRWARFMFNIWNTAGNTDATCTSWKNSLPTAPSTMATWRGIVSVNGEFDLSTSSFRTYRSLSYDSGTYDNTGGATSNGGYDYIDLTSKFGFHGSSTANNGLTPYVGFQGGSSAPFTDDASGFATGISGHKYFQMNIYIGTSADEVQNPYSGSNFNHIFFLG